MSEAQAARCPTGEAHCITCGDEGIPMRVLQRSGQDAVCVDAERATHTVALDLVASARPGDELLVHAGIAIANLGRAS